MEAPSLVSRPSLNVVARQPISIYLFLQIIISSVFDSEGLGLGLGFEGLLGKAAQGLLNEGLECPNSKLILTLKAVQGSLNGGVDRSILQEHLESWWS